MSATDSWMPFFVGRYLADTMHLQAREHGCYMLLLMHYWSHGPLEDDDKLLATVCRVSAYVWRKRIKPALLPFFEAGEDGRLYQKRADQERARAAEYQDRRDPSRQPRPKLHAIRGGKDGVSGVQNSEIPAHDDARFSPESAPENDVDSRAGTDARAFTQHNTEEVFPSGDGAGEDAAAGSALPRGAASGDARLPSERKILWTEGLDRYCDLTGRKGRAARRSLGLLLKSAKDDTSRVLMALSACPATGDAEGWLDRAVRPAEAGNGGFKNGFLDIIRDEGFLSGRPEQRGGAAPLIEADEGSVWGDDNPVVQFIEKYGGD